MKYQFKTELPHAPDSISKLHAVIAYCEYVCELSDRGCVALVHNFIWDFVSGTKLKANMMQITIGEWCIFNHVRKSRLIRQLGKIKCLRPNFGEKLDG